MTETKHTWTQGPWIISPNGIVSECGLMAVTAEAEVVCNRGNEEYYGCHGSADAYIRFSNDDIAELIIAAPETATERDRLKAINTELVAALETIVRDWDGEPEDMIDARAAIAKAKGQA